MAANQDWQAPVNGSVLRTRIPGTSLFHFGVAFLQGSLPTVLHNAKGRGVVHSGFEEFTGGQPYAVVDRPDFIVGDARVRRAFALVGRPYDLATFNCEHFVTLVCGGPPTSAQLRNATVVLLIGGFLAWASAA